MACPLCGEDRVISVNNGHDIFACGFSSDGGRVLSPCQGAHATCVCPTHDLMTGGCRCGAFDKEQAAKGQSSPQAGGGTGGSPQPNATGPLL
jgi:hypothetical protein